MSSVCEYYSNTEDKDWLLEEVEILFLKIPLSFLKILFSI